MAAEEICFLTAVELARIIASKKLSAQEVIEAHLAQIERVNPKVNAIVTFLPEQAMDLAKASRSHYDLIVGGGLADLMATLYAARRRSTRS